MTRQLNEGGVPAVVRAKAILDFVAQCELPPHVSEVARQLDLPKSSVHGLCNTLVSLGLLLRQGAGNLALGGHLMVWANAFAARSDLITSFLRLWEETPALQRHTVTLSTLDGSDVTYVACKEGIAPLGITFRIGMRLPAAFTATGKAMLSTYEDATIATLFAEGMPEPLTRMSVRRLEDLQQEVGLVRQRGYSVDNCQVRESMYCFGAPIMGFASQRAIGGIAISVLEGEVSAETERKLGGLARACAEKLSRHLGG
ncbi:IclR family transcriptional regulator [Bradyrhizobium sp.]|uniref:IclR family transcriptional regulator n=1 Tax=Bradyrhizobium sp. TaxID=376 RepID=UPI001D6AB0E5|nr:IclR family transcriptional regulator [Bradyrhizobium sp.]MBI5317829.1 IclR family transcriptional regulator [Bradyrhizobium sp.]